MIAYTVTCPRCGDCATARAGEGQTLPLISCIRCDPINYSGSRGETVVVTL